MSYCSEPGRLLLAVVVVAAPGAAAAQQEFLCADPRGFCSALIRPACLARIEDESLTDEADAECGGALIAWRACLGDAADCPGVTEPETPAAPSEAKPPCVAGQCAEEPPVPIVREAPEDRIAPQDQRPGDLGQ